MSTRKLIVFKHDSKMGNAPAHKLFEMVTVAPALNPPRDFQDYANNICVPNQQQMPEGVTVMDMIESYSPMATSVS